MKLKKNAEKLQTNNEASILEHLGLKLQDSSFTNLLLLVAEVLDAVAAGDDCFMTIGATRNRDAFIVTVVANGTRMYLGGAGIAGLALESGGFVDHPVLVKRSENP